MRRIASNIGNIPNEFDIYLDFHVVLSNAMSSLEQNLQKRNTDLYRSKC